MATIIVRACDVCGAQDGDVIDVSAQLLSYKRRAVDLCRVHYSELVMPLLLVLDEHGVVLDDKGKPKPLHRKQPPSVDGSPKRKGVTPEGPREHVCPLCPLDYATLSGLRQHTKTTHQLTLTEAREVATKGLKS